MVVRGGVAVKMVFAVSTGQLLGLTQLNQQIQIPIYGAEADIWKFLAYRRIDGICGRMVAAAHKACFDGFPLAAML